MADATTKRIKPEIKDRIIATASALVAEGIDNPTNDQIRERIGGGSLSTISPVMREWREGRKAEVLAALELPAELKRTIETSLAQMWAAASKLATESVERIKLKAESDIADVTAERDEALAEVQSMEAQLAELSVNVQAREQTITQLNDDLSHERAGAAQLKADNLALQTRVKDRDTQIADLKTEAKEAREDVRKLQAELVEIARNQ